MAIRAPNLFAVGTGAVRGASATLRRKASSRELKEQARRVLHLVERFRFKCRQRSATGQLADLVEALIPCAKAGFDLVAEMRAGRGLTTDELRCLADLDRLLRGLRCEKRPSDEELVHVMDSLIVECVRWDIAVERTGFKSGP